MALRWVTVLAALLLIGGAIAVFMARRPASMAESRIAFPAPLPGPAEELASGDFAGAAACASCHRAQYRAWSGSTHGRAGGTPGTAVLLKGFGGVPIAFRDARVTPRQRAGRYEFLVEWNDTTRVLAVDGVVGGGHLVGGGTQGFVTRGGDGSIRLLPFELEQRNGKWFCNTSTRANRGWLPVSADQALTDCGDWSPSRTVLSTRDVASCQECHVSRALPSTGGTAPQVTYSIDCEACHGPARAHAASMAAGFDSLALRPLSTASPSRALEACLTCHALKDNLRPGFVAGMQLRRYYSLPLALLDAQDLHPDGRTRTFAYQEGHLYSDCYLKSGMTCGECHEPHAQTYRDLNGVPLAGRFADQQCTACHPSKAERPERHTRHAPDTPASRCVSCHMPYLQQPDVGPAIAYGRSDHTIGIPRPAADSARGIAHACAVCHRERSTATLQQAAVKWWGELKPLPPTVARLSELGGNATAADLSALILQDDGGVPLASYRVLGQWFMALQRPGEERVAGALQKRLRTIAADSAIEPASLALAALHFSDGETAASRRFLARRLTELRAQDADLRSRWSKILGYRGDQFRSSGRPDQAVATYQKALEVAPNDARIWLSYGSALRESGRLTDAAAAFDSSARLAPGSALGWVNLGIARAGLGDEPGARQAYQQALAANPNEPLAHFNLANLDARADRIDDAIRGYDAAIALDLTIAEAHFNLARMRLAQNQPGLALRALKTGLLFDPDNAAALELHRSLVGTK